MFVKEPDSELFKQREFELQEVMQLRAQVERLEAKVNDHDSACQAYKERGDFLLNENDKLLADNAVLSATLDEMLAALRVIETEVPRLVHRVRVAENALWRAADAHHRGDTPRPTETDDCDEWRLSAEHEETERDKTGMNETPAFLFNLSAAIAHAEVLEKGGILCANKYDKVFDEMLAALKGAQVTIEAWCPCGKETSNNDNYCRVVDTIAHAEAALKGESICAK